MTPINKRVCVHHHPEGHGRKLYSICVCVDQYVSVNRCGSEHQSDLGGLSVRLSVCRLGGASVCQAVGASASPSTLRCTCTLVCGAPAVTQSVRASVWGALTVGRSVRVSDWGSFGLLVGSVSRSVDRQSVSLSINRQSVSR